VHLVFDRALHCIFGEGGAKRLIHQDMEAWEKRENM
jgi:hypothetical protein